MSTATKTLKLPFLRLNRAKAEEFAGLQTLNTLTANAILALPKGERRTLTSKAFAHVEIGSAWINQTIRNANARTKVRQFRCLPLETNNQNWTLHKVGETYSIAFGLRRGTKKRVPLAVHAASHQYWLDAVLDGRASPGSITLWCSRKGIWYACLSVSMDVPDAEPTGRWMGIDRGQNVPLTASMPEGPVLFWKANRIRHVRRVYAVRRKRLQAAGKHRAVKKLERRERRIVTHINHCLSKEVVARAQRCKAGLRLEDLSGIRQRSRQRQATKTDAGHNRDYWPFFQLEQLITYKAHLAGVAVEKVPAAYTSKSCHRCGALGTRKTHTFLCQRCHYHAHADANAAQNIRDWYGMCCPLVLEAPVDGAHGMPPNTVRKTAGFSPVVDQEREPPHGTVWNPRTSGRGGCQEIFPR
jgi:IS605 OrfB family transposase